MKKRRVRIAIGSDEKTPLTDFVVEELKKQEHALELFGSLKVKSPSRVRVGEIGSELGLTVKIQLYTIGDCFELRNVLETIADGARVAREI